MKTIKHIGASIACITAGFVASATSAQAFSFATNLDRVDPTGKGNMMLQSVTINGDTFSNFAVVQSVAVRQNDIWAGGNTGAASSDRGDNATGIVEERGTAAGLATSLGNLNMNNIVDGEDGGSFQLKLNFNQALSRLFVWERGMNSRLAVQGLDSSGQLIGKEIILGQGAWAWQSAAYAIDTTEIGGQQSVGSQGITLADLGLSDSISSIQVRAQNGFNGPDFKVIGGAEAVPEPTTMAGIALASGGLAAARRRMKKA
jgi:hypothetical protein